MPGLVVLLVGFVGFAAWTAWISVTPSRILPRYGYAGFGAYAAVTADPRFTASVHHLLTFGAAFVPTALVLGFVLAASLDRIGGRRAALLRTVFVLPLSVSWLITGLVWQWLLTPEVGGARGFGLLVRPETAPFAVVAAALWHMAGLVMAVFLAGLAGIDPAIRHAARIDGAPAWRLYGQVLLPMLGPSVVAAALLLVFATIRLFDLVVAMTGGGPGFATDVPAMLVYDYAFVRGRLAQGAAAAVLMLLAVAVPLAPALFFVLRRRA